MIVLAMIATGRPSPTVAASSTRTTAAAGDGRPTAIVAHTTKGKGVSFMEGHYFWHTRIITPEEFAIAMADLGEPMPADGPAPAQTVAPKPAAEGATR